MPRTPISMTHLPAVALAALALLLAGCGQKGPLYLPDDASANSTNTPAAERPAEE